MKSNAKYNYLMLLLATLCSLEVSGQPRLVVNITIDQLRSDYLELYAPLYGQDGLRRLLDEGRVYDNAQFAFSPVDRASAIACLTTGAPPQYNKVYANARPDEQLHNAQPTIACSTISDEMKLATNGSAVVYSVAGDQATATLAGGHAANGAYWMRDNASIVSSALTWMNVGVMGRDNVPDYLAVTLSAALPLNTAAHSDDAETIYRDLDSSLGRLISEVETTVGRDNVLFVLSGTGYADEREPDYARFNIPTGTFYINRTASLLNMYLSAIYGSGRWVDAYYKNQIYLNHKLIEDKRVNYSELTQRSRDFLLSVTGVADVEPSPYNTTITGDLWVEVNPGWKVVNEDTHESYYSRSACVPFPVIFYGAGVQAARLTDPVNVETVAATIAKVLHIRATPARRRTAL